MPRGQPSVVILSGAKNLSLDRASKKEGFFVAVLLRMTTLAGVAHRGCPILRAPIEALLAHREKVSHKQTARPGAREGWDSVILSGTGAPRVRRFCAFWGGVAKNLSSQLARAFALAALLFAFSGAASAGTVTGTVRNGTDGKLASGVDVILIQLQGGMQPVANTKSDAQGAYKFDFPAIGQQPMLIRAVYHGVMFHQPLPPGRDKVDVTVYEPSADSKIVNVGSRVIVFQPNGSNLLVGEEYALQNQSQPPKAFFDDKGDFQFQLPQGAQLGQVSSWGPSGMPVVQGTTDRGKGKYAIAYVFQPGDNGVRFSYQLPYPSNHADLRLTSDYSVGRVMLVAPPSVTLKSDGFTAAGTEQGFNLYTRDGVPAGLPFDVSVSGTAPPPQASGQGQGNDQDPEVNSRVSATVQALPNRLDSLRWIIIGGFAALFALGVLLLWRQPALATAAGASDVRVPPAASQGPRKRKASPVAPSTAKAMPGSVAPAPVKSSPAAVAPPPAPQGPPTHAGVARVGVEPVRPASAVAAAGVSSVESEVQSNLDTLKDKLFRLELRRQAGTISEEDYARERARTEAILRELVRG